MGNRGQINIDNEVYFYSHSGGDDVSLMEVMEKALKRKQRWDDAPYLARIIFCTMVKGREDGELGYGIAGESFGKNTIKVSTKNKTVKMGDFSFSFSDVADGKWRKNLSQDGEQ